MDFRQQLSAAMQRIDGWANAFSGVGNVAGRNSRTRFQFQGNDTLGLPVLEQLYHEDPYAARIADSVPKHALRPGATVKAGSAEEQTAINGAMDDLKVLARVREAWTWARVFGGGAVVLGCDDGRGPDVEIDTANLRSVRYLVSVTARELNPESWERDPLNARFGEPITYRLTRSGGGGGTDQTLVHHSRVVRFEGLATTRDRRITLQGWGESYLQRAVEALQEWNGAHASVNELLQQLSLGVFSMKNLMLLVGNDPEGILKARLEAMDMARSVSRSILIDADGESFERTEVGALSGVPDLLDRFSLRLSGACEIPVSVLLGRSPAGLNATGESDIETWDNSVDAERRTVLKPALERIVTLLLLSREGPTKGVEPEGWSIELPSLREPTPTQTADLRYKVAQTDDVYLRNGVGTPEDVARSRFRPEGWSMETVLTMEDPSVGDTGPGVPAEHAADVSKILAQVAGREIPRDSGVAILVQMFGMPAEVAEAVMGAAGLTFFTAPDPAAVAELDAMRGENAKLKASNQGHKAYTARIIERAKAGGLELGAFTSAEPTATEEGEVLKVGDVVEVPAEDPAAAPVAEGAVS